MTARAPARRRPLLSGNLAPRQVDYLLRHVGGLDPAYRGFLTEPQIRRQSAQFVSSQLDPQRRETMAAIERRSAAGTGAISGYTSEHEAQLAKLAPLVDASYGRQASDEKAASDALSQMIEGRGQAQSAELAAKLRAAGIEGPAPAPVAAGPAGPAPVSPAPASTPIPLSQLSARLGHGAAAASAAGGYADLSRLAAEGGSQRVYANELPAIASLGGAASVRDLQLQLNKEASDRLGAIAAEAPGMAAQQAETLRNRNLAKGSARNAALNAYLDRNLQSQVASAGLGFKYDSLAGQNQRASAAQSGATQRTRMQQQGANARAAMSNSIAAANAAEKARHDQAGEAGKAASVRRPNAALSSKYGYIVDANGKPILGKGGKKIMVVKSSSPYGTVVVASKKP